MLFGRPIAAHFGDAYLGVGKDQSLFIWCLGWWPYALAHHLNPFVTKLIFAPSGYNLTWSTSVPLISIVAAPITRIAGPIAAYNLLCVICPALAAWTAFLLCRYLTGQFWPSLLGGYLFGFSSYVLGQVLGGHLHCFSVFLIPLVVYMGLLGIECRITDRALALWLSALLAAELLIAEEFVATLTIIAAAAIAIAWALGDSAARTRLASMVRPLGLSYLGAIALTSPWLYYVAAGFVHRSLHSPRMHSADLLNFVVPTPTVEIGSAVDVFHRLSSRFISNPTESGAYVGLPLLAIALWFAVAQWRALASKVLALTAAAAALLAMGPRLHVLGAATVPLPWTLLYHLPLLNQVLPIRLTVYVSLALAIIAAMWFSADHLPRWARMVAAGLVLGSLFPNPARSLWTPTGGRSMIPPFIRDGLYRTHLMKDETVISPPLNYGTGADTMLWQVESAMYFRLGSGYLTIAPEAVTDWPIVRAALQGVELADAADQFVAYAASRKAGVVMLAEPANQDNSPQTVRLRQMLRGLGAPESQAGGVVLYRLRPDTLARFSGVTPAQMETIEDENRLKALLLASSRYLAGGGNPSRLGLEGAAQAGLVPGAWASRAMRISSYTVVLEPKDDGRIGVGIKCGCRALAPLVGKYGVFAKSVYFPYPHPLREIPAECGHGLQVLEMVFDREGLERAAAAATQGSGG